MRPRRSTSRGKHGCCANGGLHRSVQRKIAREPVAAYVGVCGAVEGDRRSAVDVPASEVGAEQQRVAGRIQLQNKSVLTTTETRTKG